MKTFLSFVLFLSLSSLGFAQDEVKANEKAPIYLSYCSHFGQGVSYSFQSCVNSNFSSVSRVMGGFISNCYNIGNEVSFSFTSCVNSGFRTIERQFNNAIWLQECMNFDRQTLDYSFVSCVNSNFGTIQRAITNL